MTPRLGTARCGSAWLLVVIAALVSGCKRKSEPSTESPPVERSAPAPAPAVTAEAIPRCRVEGPRVAFEGEDVVVGDVAIDDAALVVGFVRRSSVPGEGLTNCLLRAPLDLASSSVIVLGPAGPSEAAPSPRAVRGEFFVAESVRIAPREGETTSTRELRLRKVDGSGNRVFASVSQQRDESTAFDVAWPDGPVADDADAGAGSPILVAWDEDAPTADGTAIAERGFIKVAPVYGRGKGRSRIASPETSDAESPKLLARKGGYWLAWLARRPEGDAPSGVEGPGETRAFRWIELIALDAHGEPTSPVRRVSPEKGRIASFDLVRTAGGGSEIAIVAQDEAALHEGAGGRLLRYGLEGDRVTSTELIDGGLGSAAAELAVSGPDAGARWLSWTDSADQTRIVPLGGGMLPLGPLTVEPVLEGARIVASSARGVYAIAAPTAGPGARPGALELRRLVCSPVGSGGAAGSAGRTER